MKKSNAIVMLTERQKGGVGDILKNRKIIHLQSELDE